MRLLRFLASIRLTLGYLRSPRCVENCLVKTNSLIMGSRAGGTGLESPILLSSSDPEPQRGDLWLFIGQF